MQRSDTLLDLGLFADTVAEIIQLRSADFALADGRYGDDGGRIRIHNGALNEHWCDGQECDVAGVLLIIDPISLRSLTKTECLSSFNLSQSK